MTIHIAQKGLNEKSEYYCNSYLRFKKEERPNLSKDKVSYCLNESPFGLFSNSLEKMSRKEHRSIISKLGLCNKKVQSISQKQISDHTLYYTRKFGYFLAFLDFIPEMHDLSNGKLKHPSELKSLYFHSIQNLNLAIGILTSSTFFLYWNTLSDCRNLNKKEIINLPLPKSYENAYSILNRLVTEYLNSLKANSKFMVKSGNSIQTFNYSKSKPIIDQIDTVLAQHYGFTEEELDFIINYDIKYRMGKALFGDTENETEE